jgi:hypothetical protein
VDGPSNIRGTRLGRAARALLALAALCGGAAGCRRGATTAPAAGTANADAHLAAGGDAASAPTTSPAGMKVPFTPLDAASAKSLAAGFKAFRAAKYADARDLFHRVVVARPDYTPARYQELRAAALADPSSDLRERWRELLMRDFIGYAGRLKTQKEFAPQRGSTQGPELDRTLTAARKAMPTGSTGASSSWRAASPPNRRSTTSRASPSWS